MADVVPLISVVIPTHNRRASLVRALESLARQTLDATLYDVVVVIDAGTDDTAATLDAATYPFAVQHLGSASRGAAAARNTGAAVARGGRIVFLDDDMVCDPGFLQAHLPDDAAEAGIIVGQSAPAVTDGGYLGRALDAWWRGRFVEMAEPGYRFGYTEVMSGNMSVPRQAFERMGGFDASLLCREDYEFGIRAVAAGVPISYAAEARALHHDASTPARNLLRARNEGIADFQVGRKHPVIFRWLKAANMTAPTAGSRVLRLLCFDATTVCDIGIRILSGLATGAETLQLWDRWQQLTSAARTLSYHRGVAEAAGRFDVLRDLGRQSTAVWRDPEPVQVDLLDTPPTATPALLAGPVEALTLTVGPTIIGRLHADPGREPIGPRHLDALVRGRIWHWAIHVEAMAKLRPLPETEPEWLAAAVRARLQTPCLAEVDLADWTIEPRSGRIGFPMRILVRHGQRMLGWTTLSKQPEPGAFWSSLRGLTLSNHAVCARLERAGLSEHVPVHRPPISVVVCTRDRARTLERCLAALASIDYSGHEIIVVDNASRTDETRALVARTEGVRYVREDRPGLDWARNRGIEEARHPIVAFTDDDTRVDRHWLTSLGRTFADPAVDFVTGLVVPMALDAAAQVYFEDVYGGMGKGFDALTRDPSQMWPHDLLWASGLGVGANMAFRKRVFETAGAFDPALDVGTATRGGGDIEMFHRALARCCLHVYQPDAFVWHEHRTDWVGLRGQMADNGSGFAAYLLAAWRNRTVPRMSIVRFAGRAWGLDWQIKRLLRPGAHRRGLVVAEIGGALKGPRRWSVAQTQAVELTTGAGTGPAAGRAGPAE